MAELISLKMTGIRSIGDEPHVIKFLNPLTIIQGLNGTGKTTTTEALNYITTGSLPTGGLRAFIHNNLIANKKRVDGSVMLQFKDAKGQEVTATKRMFASTANKSKKGEATTRSDEFTMSYKDALGEVHQISSKVVDFNKEMVNRLGVPKAILDYVLFCHQEESNWPLSEPKALKVRFDGIFEVTKYSKALVTIKKMIKAHEDKIKRADAELPYIFENRSDRIRALQESEHCKERINELTVQMDKNEALQREKKEKLGEMRSNIDKAYEVQKETELLEQKRGWLQQQLRSVNVDDVGSIENLREDVQQCLGELGDVSILEEAVQRKKKQRTLVYEKLRRLRKEESELQELTQEESNLVRKTAEKANHERKLKEYCVKLNNEFSSLLGSVPEDSFRSKIATVSSDCDRQLRSAELTMRGAERDYTQNGHQLQQVNRDLSRKKEELLSHMERISSVISEPSQVKERIEQSRKILDKSRSQLGQIDGCNFLYEKWEKDVLECKACPLCERSYRAIADVDKLAAKIRERRSELPKEKGNLSSAVKKREQEIYELTKLEPIVEMASSIERNQIPELEKRLGSLKLKCDESEKRRVEAESKLRELKEREKMVKSVTADASLMDNHKQAIDNLEEEISRVHDRMGSQEDRKNVIEVKTTIENCETQYEELNSQIEKDQLMVERKKYLGLHDDIEAISVKLSNVQWTGEPLQEMKRKFDQMNREVLKLNTEYHKASGELSQMRKRSQEIQQHIKNKYANVEKDFRKKLIEKCTWQKAVKDLKTYFRVVDESIIAFHQAKMEQINNILEDLWRRVYRGNDIQTIRIKSNAVDSSEDKRKSYDYCVVMSVDNVEIEMRDRCSAGQKVLACILIRIALADVFAGGCSILALDEPTTNLDVDKVEAMGEMLNSLIKCRSTTNDAQATKGFQLIVITHDLRLVENLYRDCRPEYVYGLSKDEFGVSRIKKHTHFELSD